MKNLKLVFVLFVGIALAVIGCSKGNTGPAGPAGPAGPDSVMYSPWITLNTPFNTTDSGYEQTITANSITQAIIDKGIILTYLDIGGSGNNQVFPTSSVGFVVSETYVVGKIEIFSVSDLTGIGFRYVVVPGTIAANKIVSGPAKGLTKQQLINMSYDEVQGLLGSSGTKQIMQ